MYIKFAGLPVHDQDRAISFYTRNFDCEVVNDSAYEEGGWRWIELRFGDGQTTLQFDKREDNSPGEEPVLVLVDAELENTVARLKSHAVEIITEPTQAPWQPDWQYAEFRDSEGNRMVISTG